MSTIWVLLMLWGASNHQSGIAVVQQEFTSWEACERARKAMAAAHDIPDIAMKVRAQGCFKK